MTMTKVYKLIMEVVLELNFSNSESNLEYDVEYIKVLFEHFVKKDLLYKV